MNMLHDESSLNIVTLRHKISKLFDEAVGGAFNDNQSAVRDDPALNMYATDTAINVDVVLAGIDPDEVNITIHGFLLTIKGTRHTTQEPENKQYYRREVRYGLLTRTIQVPPVADVTKGEATFTDGVLRISFPKRAVAEPQRLPIKHPLAAEQPLAAAHDVPTTPSIVLPTESEVPRNYLPDLYSWAQ